jgi:methionyl-tRNA formyltransferase
MRVALMGQAAFGEATLKRLMDDGIEIAGVCAPASAGRLDPLWSAAEASSLTTIPTATLREGAGLQAWRGLDADLGVMAFVTDIIPPDALNAPRLGTIQYHPSLLPLHRGSSAINWAIINGDPETGLSIFWPDRGVDTGPILVQKRTPLGPDDTVATVYFGRLFPMGVEAIAESVRLVSEGKAPRTEQDHRRATYEPPCGDEHAAIRWYGTTRLSECRGLSGDATRNQAPGQPSKARGCAFSTAA